MGWINVDIDGIEQPRRLLFNFLKKIWLADYS